jgi:hypothetical protein
MNAVVQSCAQNLGKALGVHDSILNPSESVDRATVGNVVPDADMHDRADDKSIMMLHDRAAHES